ncbi:transposase [Patescibacteria group bacterium]|nr:transposase [Patescibacteria group bacterium]
MPRRENISIGEYYHIFNRENNKQNLFREERDWVRFLFLVLYLQSPLVFNNPGRSISYFVRHRKFNIPKDIEKNVIKNRYAELVNFCLMPNHFHLTVREIKEGGISKYLQRIQIGYTKYLNIKYAKSGHVFQGSFRSVHIKNNEQLLHLSAYIHRNPRELKKYKNKESDYFWSSYQDYIKENRWNNFLKTKIILGQFSNKKEYDNFAKTSGTKLLLKENHLI